MACDSQTLMTSAASAGLYSLSDRDLLMCMVYGIATNPGAGTSAQTLMTGAIAQGYYKMSDRDLWEALLTVLCGGP